MSDPAPPLRALPVRRSRRLVPLLLAGAVLLTLLAGLHEAVEHSPLPAMEQLGAVQRLDLRRLFSPQAETVTVTPGSAAVQAEAGMSPKALMARWEPLIEKASRKFKVPAQWIRAVMAAETGGRTVLADGRAIVSPAGALGIMQVMPATYEEMARQYGLGADPFNPHDNIFAGAAYLNWLHRKYGYPAMFAAYNDGPGNVEDHLDRGRPLPVETRGYMASIGHYLNDKSVSGSEVALTQPDGVKVSIDADKVTAVKPPLPGLYAPQVHAVIHMGKTRRGVREEVAQAARLLRAHGAQI